MKDFLRAPFAFIMAFAILVMSVSTDSRPAHAAPTGAVLTQEIIAGAGATIYLLKYAAAVRHLRGSVREAQETINSRDIAKFAYRYAEQNDCTDVVVAEAAPGSACFGGTFVASSLQTIRDNLTVEVAKHWADPMERPGLAAGATPTAPPTGQPVLTRPAKQSKTPPRWRKYYEDYFACYGQVMFKLGGSPSASTPTPGAGGSSGAPKSDSTGAAKPSAAPTAGGGAHPKATNKPKTAWNQQPFAVLAASSARFFFASARASRAPSPRPIGAPASAAPTAAATAAPTAAATAAPSATPTPAAGCAELIADYTARIPAAAAPSRPPAPAPGVGGAPPPAGSPPPQAKKSPSPDAALLYPIDPINLAQSLANAPSLLQQVGDQNVGTYWADNGVRIAFLIRSGADLLNYIAPNNYPRITQIKEVGAPVPFTTPQPLESDYSALYSNCASANPFSALTCLGSVSQLEQKAETARQQKIACDWARTVWLPTYSALQIFPGKPEHWGSPAGC